MRSSTVLARHPLRSLLALVAACTGLATPQGSSAGPWEARSAQGLKVRIVQDSFRTRDGYLLTRSYPDGGVDAGFGDQGATMFSLGPDNEGPSALRLDPLGRAWVAGASAGSGDSLSAVVLRFLASGVADASYAERGRSTSAPAGRRARALDLAPQADGSTYVAGQVLDAQGAERVGWWRLAPDGRVDTRFALGGLWVDEQAGSTEVRALGTGGDGSVALGLVRGQGVTAQAEIWVLAPGSGSPQRATVAAATDSTGVVWSAGQWRWASDGLSRAAADPALRPLAPGPDPSVVSPGPAAAGAAPSRADSPAAGAVASAATAAGQPADASRSAAGGGLGWWWGLGLLAWVVAGLVWRLWHQQIRNQT